MRKIIKGAATLVSLVSLMALGYTIYIGNSIPDSITLIEGQPLEIHSHYTITLDYKEAVRETFTPAGDHFEVDVRTIGGLQVKTVNVRVVDRKTVLVGGSPIGIKLYTQGVIVVGLSDIPVDSRTENPAKVAGIKNGDIILEMNGEEITSNKQVGQIVANSNGAPIEIKLSRNGVIHYVTLVPVRSDTDGKYRAGIWVRDSSAGIGTITYYDPSTGIFSGLGHAICDVDTGAIMPLRYGELVDVQITDVKQGTAGNPGELKGLLLDHKLGELTMNTPTGIYGYLNNASALTPYMIELPLATRSEVVEGPAVIRTTIFGNEPREFEIVIEKINVNESSPTKNLVIRVTDPELIAATGGIVQGMSGSPIIQNGMIVGSVTHVFVNDPLRGFGIFAENVFENALLETDEWKKAS